MIKFIINQFSKGLLVCLLCFQYSAQADVLSMSVGQQSQEQNKPQHGQSMQQIEAHFGQPLVRKGAVGEPPITVWKYSKFTVYFEYNKVIHSVAHKR